MAQKGAKAPSRAGPETVENDEPIWHGSAQIDYCQRAIIEGWPCQAWGKEGGTARARERMALFVSLDHETRLAGVQPIA